MYISIKTKTGSLLNDATKKTIAADLRKYAMASIDPVIIDPEQMYLYIKVFGQYDPALHQILLILKLIFKMELMIGRHNLKSTTSIPPLEHKRLKKQLLYLIRVSVMYLCNFLY